MKFILTKLFTATVALSFSCLGAHAAGEQDSSQMTTQRAARQSSTHTNVKGKSSGKLDSPVKREKLLPMLYASQQDADMDWWYRIPSDSGPHIADAKKIFYGQDFNLFAFVNGASSKDKKFNLSYTIKLIQPNGKEIKIVDNPDFTGGKPSENMILACPDVATLRFDEKYPDGKYIFEIAVTDKLSGATSKEQAQIYLYKWSAPNPLMDKKVVQKKLRGFFSEPSPEDLYAIFFSKDFNLEQRSAPNSLNFSHIGFLRAAFGRNAFLLPIIRAQFADANELDRAKIIFLFAILNDKPIDDALLKEHEKNYQKKLREMEIPNPYGEWEPVLGAVQVDLLWGEFYANGTYKPFRRIIDIIGLTEEASYADSMRAAKKRPENKEQWRKFLLGMTSRAALSTIAINAQSIDLVRKYASWALQNNDIPPNSRKILLEEDEPKQAAKASAQPEAKKTSGAANSSVQAEPQDSSKNTK